MKNQPFDSVGKLDALMAEYDPRPSVSRRDHAFDKLRKNLPRQINNPTYCVGSADEGGDGVGGIHENPYDCGAMQSKKYVGKNEGERGGKGHEDTDTDDGYSTYDHSDGNREDNPSGGVGGVGGSQSPLRAGDHGTYADADRIVGHIDSAQGGDNSRGGAAGSGGMANTGSDDVAAVDDLGAEEIPPESPPLTTLTASTGRGVEENDENSAVLSDKAKVGTAVGDGRPRGGVAGGGDQTKRPVTAGQRKVPSKGGSQPKPKRAPKPSTIENQPCSTWYKCFFCLLASVACTHS